MCVCGSGVIPQSCPINGFVITNGTMINLEMVDADPPLPSVPHSPHVIGLCVDPC